MNRGVVWLEKGDNRPRHRRLQRSHPTSIRKYALAYTNRGNAWQAKGNIERANADFDAAKRLGQKE